MRATKSKIQKQQATATHTKLMNATAAVDTLPKQAHPNDWTSGHSEQKGKGQVGAKRKERESIGQADTQKKGETAE